ncbi:unnamed protein product, partial [Prunus brigantina]
MKMMKNQNKEFLATILEFLKIYFSIPSAHLFFFSFVLFWVRASDCLNIIKIKIKTLPKKITKNWYITERPCHIRRMGTHQM